MEPRTKGPLSARLPVTFNWEFITIKLLGHVLIEKFEPRKAVSKHIMVWLHKIGEKYFSPKCCSTFRKIHGGTFEKVRNLFSFR